MDSPNGLGQVTHVTRQQVYVRSGRLATAALCWIRSVTLGSNVQKCVSGLKKTPDLTIELDVRQCYESMVVFGCTLRQGKLTMSPPMTRDQVLNRYFPEIRCKIIEVAASLDRMDRAESAGNGRADPRVDKLTQAIRA